MAKVKPEMLKLQEMLRKGEKLMSRLLIGETSDSLDEIETCLVRAEAFTDSVGTFYKIQEKLLHEVTDEIADELHKLIEAYEDVSYSVKSKHRKLTRIFDQMLAKENSVNNVVSETNFSASMKLPPLQIPWFSGDVASYQSFMELFNSLVDKAKISEVEKLHHLISHLQGEALNLVRGLKITSANYSVALEILNKRYLNVRLVANTYLQNLSKIPHIVERSPSSIRKVLDLFNENWLALKALVPDTDDQLNLIVGSLLLSKLDIVTREQFELSIADNAGKIPSIELLMEFISKQSYALNNLTATTNTSKLYKVDKKEQFQAYKPYKNKMSHALMANSVMKCPLCMQNHDLATCDSFLVKSPLERFRWVKQKHRCLVCLQDSHLASSCKVQKLCTLCNKRHNVLLHYGKVVSVEEKAGPVTPHSSVSLNREKLHAQDNLKSEAGSSGFVSFSGMAESQTTVLLGTAIVNIVNSCNAKVPIRVLLDCGAQVSCITENCVQKLGLQRSRSSMIIKGLGDNLNKSLGVVSCSLQPRPADSPPLAVTAQILNSICSDMPSAHIGNKKWNHLRNLNLADPSFSTKGSVDLLLGADIFPHILLGPTIAGQNNEPAAINTIFGYVIMGKVSSNQQDNAVCYFVESNLDESVKKFWELEQVPQPQVLEPCETHFIENFKRNSDGTYTVALPFKDGCPPIFGDSYSVALRCLKSLENRLLKNPDMHASYHKAMQDYITSGHMSLATKPIQSNGFYVPHHGVFKLQSSSTQLRVVMNASCKSSNGISLNDALLPGPKLHTDIVEVLLNFRLHKYSLVADIKKMYNQIFICEDHCDFQRVLWRSSPDMPVQEFVMNRVMFGVSSAPFLALRTLKQLAQDESASFPRASKVLSTDTYVDDIISGANTIQDTQDLACELLELLKRGGFELKKFASNEPLVINSLDKTLQQSVSFDKDEPSYIKILGLQWIPATDCYSYNICVQKRECTKRSILSELARIFDPLGFLAPVVVFAKHLVQRLWMLGLGWDESPPPDIVNIWKNFQSELPCLKQIAIQRYFQLDEAVTYELHAFCDSSEIAYAAVIYFRIIYANRVIRTILVISRTRVTPLKRHSIPRLELCAAVLLAELVGFVLKVFKETIKFSKIVAWSDSQVVLSWIRSPSYNWKTFVANRVALIQDQLPASHWRHVRSEHNPCDCASRGLLPSQLLGHFQWWAGPFWLCQPDDCFPPQPVLSGTREEVRDIVCLVSYSEETLLSLIDKYSSLSKLLRVVSYCIRFINYTRKDKRFTGAFSTKELHKSLVVLVRLVQQRDFKAEIDQLKRDKICCKSISRLNPFLDSENLIRVGGRLRNSALGYDSKHPFLLPSKGTLTQLIIEYYHKVYLHPGYNNLVALLRRQFWVLSPHRAVRSVLSKCLQCFRVNPKRAVPPIMADLPENRVSAVKVFKIVGVDMGGPFTITSSKLRGAKVLKAYICLFICFTTKAIHLECASDLSAEAFLAAFRRFIARRGACSYIYSDCGTNFVAANKAIVQHLRSAVESEGLVWHFNPPAAPHMGGLWEAGIKSVKTHLIRIIGEQILTYEEFTTVLTQIESVLNSRPLFANSADPNDFQAITPNHFLNMEPLGTFYEDDLTDINLSRLSRWQKVQALQQQFWKRWSREYLHTLQQRNSFISTGTPVAEGMLVLICNESLPPLQWRLGRIIALHPGTDGCVRVVTVQTSLGSYKRPVVKLCPLPIQ